MQLENKKLIYRFSSTSFQINQEIPEEPIQEDQLQQRTMQQILTAPLITENFFVYANGLIASQDNSGNTHYYYKDNLGSTRAITDATGSVIYTASYQPFGTSILETGNSEYTYTGKSQDDSALYYYGARYYDSNLGRFTQIDPILNGEDSPYAYVDNNPLKYVDPTGISPENPNIYSDYGIDVNNIKNSPVLHATKNKANRLVRAYEQKNADVLFISGHHYSESGYFFGSSRTNDFDLSELESSENIKACGLSGCHTISSPQERDATRELKTLINKFENLNIVLGYLSKSPEWDSRLSERLGEVIKPYLDESDYEGLARFWITEGQKILEEEEGYKRGVLAAYYKKDGAWYFINALSKNPSALSDINSENQQP